MGIRSTRTDSIANSVNNTVTTFFQSLNAHVTNLLLPYRDKHGYKLKGAQNDFSKFGQGTCLTDDIDRNRIWNIALSHMDFEMSQKCFSLTYKLLQKNYGK